MTDKTAQDAIAELKHWMEHNEVAPRIAKAIYEWTDFAFNDWDSASASDVLHHLETTNCASCHAPFNLIYDHEVAQKVPLWWNEIDAALDEYHESMGENISPRHNNVITITFFVWFAVEWFADQAAGHIRDWMES